MAKTQHIDWFASLAKVAGWDEALSEILREQLEHDFAEKAAMPIPANAFLMPPGPGPLQVKSQRTLHYLDADLVIVAEGFPVRIAWMVSGAEQRAWWDLLPIEDLRDLYAHALNPFTPDRFHFPVDYLVLQLPDVMVELVSESGLAELIARTMTEEIERYNAEEQGLIHNFGEVREETPGHYRFSMDLGSALFEGLGLVLDRLNAALPFISRVKVRDYTDL